MFRERPSTCGHHAFHLPPHRSSMRSQQLAVLDMSALRGVALTRGRIADVERAVAPHGVRDHRQLARHRDTGFAVAGAFGDLPAPVLDPVLAP